MRKIKYTILAVLITGIFVHCKPSFENPNAADTADALNTPEGMVSLLVGIKHRFAVNSKYGNGGVFNGITTNGFITREVKLSSGANPDYVQFNAGGCNIVPNNNTLTDLWANCLLVIKNSNDLLDNVHKVGDDGLRQAIQKYAYLYKAMAMGSLAMYWKEQPENTVANAVFISRESALTQAIELLDKAYALPFTVPAAYIASFGTEIDLQNTLLALSARYFLVLGNFDAAVERASQVDLTKKSVYFYNTQNTNPLYTSAFTNINGYLPQKNFGLPDNLLPDPNDQRIVFYLTPSGTGAPGFGFGKHDNDLVPLYLPGEMWLIMAEGYARKDDLENAKLFLDKVLTKTAAQDLFQVGAALPAYEGPMDKAALLQEIYKNRCIELYMSGQKLEDSRRFERPGPKDPKPERTLDFYPYPYQERSGNPNTPEDPGC